MAIPNELILESIDNIAQLKCIQMDPIALADDVVLMAFVFNEQIIFQQAMDNIIRSLQLLAQGKVSTSELVHNYSDWDSFHFQSQRTSGQRADLRIVFQRVTIDAIRIKGFGHRHLPVDIYDRLNPRK